MQTPLENAKRLSQLKQNLALPEYRRFLFAPVVDSTAKITGIYGSRGVGKTTLLLQVMRAAVLDETQKLYISCDHPMFKEVGFIWIYA